MNENTNDIPGPHRDQTVEIAGETITVREFRYREAIEAAGLARPFLTAMRIMVSKSDEAGEGIEAEDLDALIAAYVDIWLALVAKACGRDVAWVEALPDHEANKLQMAFWAANGVFFTSRLIFSSAFARAVKTRRAAPSARPAPDSAAPA